jgi:hypothetical protein
MVRPGRRKQAGREGMREKRKGRSEEGGGMTEVWKARREEGGVGREEGGDRRQEGGGLHRSYRAKRGLMFHEFRPNGRRGLEEIPHARARGARRIS